MWCGVVWCATVTAAAAVAVVSRLRLRWLQKGEEVPDVAARADWVYVLVSHHHVLRLALPHGGRRVHQVHGRLGLWRRLYIYSMGWHSSSTVVGLLPLPLLGVL